MFRGENTRPSFPPSIFLSIPILVPPGPRKTYCMTVDKSPKPDLGYQYTSVRKIPHDLNVTR